MGGVIISPNLKRGKSFIDADGNEVKPYTKQIIQRREEEPVEQPVVEEVKVVGEFETPLSEEEIKKIKDSGGYYSPEKRIIQEDHVSTPSPIAKMIREQVQKAVLDSVKEINIKQIVDEAISEAFK